MQSSASTKVVRSIPFSAILDRQIDEVTAGLSSLFYANSIRSLPSEENIKTIINYILAAKTETNLSDSYRKNIIEALCRFSKHNPVSFRDITRDDIIAFLDTFRKTETQDPLHKWIGTYNIYLIHLSRFFKWLYSPNITQADRPKPSILENIPKLYDLDMQIKVVREEECAL